jgi:hypothetical protein
LLVTAALRVQIYLFIYLFTFSGLEKRMRRGRRGREGARAAVSTLWVLAQIYLLVNSPGIHISSTHYSSPVNC